ncbi:RHS repeat-associated core domain-containing protein [Amycolatopsis sp. NPDC098790]|uniref:RHS repeat-associated core domain-containing protein n=1 Tax=Amycolatopsis sp. NPDC098790 TaxID=3363939 RepID=UPI0038071A9B
MRTRTKALVMSVALAATLVQAPAAALAAGGPSVPLPDVPSVPVTPAGHGNPPSADETTPRGMHGDQTAGRAGSPGGGDYAATSLSPSATWQVSGQTGDFSWSYPLRTPPAPGGLQPNLALSYSSGAVDGLTSSTNNQASWVGDGWTLWPGFIERTYRSCADDVGGAEPPGDLCWHTDNATMSLSGSGSQLIRDDATGVWRPKSDDGSRIERLTTPGNGDDDGESWKVTTVEGMQYFFGSVPAARSTWTAPVFGDDANEPCHGATFAASACVQGYRWNLDKVVDRNGNMVLFTYQTETNFYGKNKNSSAASYVRGGWLEQVRYGLRADDASVPATAQVDFEVTDRCVPGSDCTLAKPLNLPDVPLDLKCDGGSCVDKWSPTFWSTKQLFRITTKVRAGSTYAPVDSWTLRHELPDPGDGEKPALWLKGITHTGLAGSELPLPEVTFDGARKPNRVHGTDGYAALIRFRMNAVVSETGGVTSVGYAEPDCVFGTHMPANAESNTLRCFPVRWRPKGAPERTDYFHKYVVSSVTTHDGVAGSIPAVTSYEYLGGAAWHWDTSEFTDDDEKTWNEFRGFARTRTRTGTGDDGPKTMTEQRSYRGMDGDRLPGGGTRAVTVPATEGADRTDSDWLAGFGYETLTFDREKPSSEPDPPLVAKSIVDPAVQGPTATRAAFKAYLVRTGVQREYTALRAGGRRTTKTETAYDGRGLPTQVDDLGDIDTPDDDRCTRTTYARDEGRWLLNFASRVETVSVACTRTPVFPADALGDSRISYDGKAPGEAPVAGNPTRTEVAAARPATGPEYVTTATTAYDKHGRPTETTDPLGAVTKVAFTPALGGPVTRTTTTTPPVPAVPAGLVTTSTLDPASGLPTKVVDPNNRTTETTYDALGRKTEVWLPNRPRAKYPQGNLKFAYDVRTDRAPAVTTTRIGPNGVYTSSTELYDGQLRTRQVQSAAAGGGRLLADTRYDSHGRAYKKTQPYFNDAPADTTLVLPSDVDVPGVTTTEYDGAGRPVAEVFRGGPVEWRTTTAYGGDRVDVTPPQGGTATTTITDARGQTVEQRQYQAPTPTGPFTATTYGYTKAGQLAAVTDAAGTGWRFGYDLRGRGVRAEDPDTGVSETTYDNADRPTSTKDGRGITLAYSYDALNRKTGTYLGQVGGTQLAGWTYDTAFNGKGQQATATRFADGRAYTSSVFNYTPLYQPTETSVTIPAADRELEPIAGTYTANFGYGWDGSLSGESYPAAGGLPAETVDYRLDDWARPLSSSGAYNGTVELATDVSYTRYGEVQRLQLGTGTKRAWSSQYYEENTRRLSRTVVDAEVPRPMQADVNHTYDPIGNLTSVADRFTADTQCFRYDNLRRLTEAWTPTGDCAAQPSSGALGGPAPYWQSFTYDTAGNRRTATQHATTGDTTDTFTYPAPTQARPHAVSSVATTAANGQPRQFTYDDGGNTTGRTRAAAGETLTWTAEGQLESVTKDGKKTSFVYSAAGDRLLKRDPSGITLYLGNQEVRLAAGTATCTRYYQLGGAPIAIRQGAKLTWLASDHQGTAQIAIDAGTQQVTQRRQTPFGTPRGAAPSSWPGERGFVGGASDASTGLTHLGAREYDPELGRFLSVDPVMDQEDPQQMNGYAYSNNSPVTFQDASGLFTSECDNCGYVDSKALMNKQNNPKSKPYTPRGKPNGTGKILPADTVFAVPKKFNDILGAVMESLKPRLFEKQIADMGLFRAYQEFQWNNRWYSKLLDIIDSKWMASLGRLSALLGFGLSYADYRAKGDRPVAAGIKAGIETVFSWGGAILGGGAGGLLGAPYGMFGSPIGMAIGGGVGAYVGNTVGGWVAEVADPVIDAVGNTVENGFQPGNLVDSRFFDIGIRVQATAHDSIREKAEDGEISGSDIVESSIDAGLSIFGW